MDAYERRTNGETQKMICEECKAAGLKSCVYEGYSTCTAMFNAAYYDEEGKHHFHDMNITTTTYSCTNGHQFSKQYKPVWVCCENKEVKNE
jgi:hypothetical protein